MELYLQGKKALVTGSTSGIGKAIAIALATEGAHVLINGRNEDSIIQTIKDIRDRHPSATLETAVADLGSEQGYERIISEHPEIDILINNVGIFEKVNFFETLDSDWYKFFDVNIMSGVRLSRFYLHRMIEKQDGRILFIGSEAAVPPPVDMTRYSTTKAMQLSVSRSLAELTTGTRVTVNTVMPGSTLTEGVKNMLMTLYPNDAMTMEEAETRYMTESRPTSIIKRFIRPEEVANLVTFLSSPLSSAINGAALRIDGGLVQHII
ncbi:3-oxoacyl-[acyl-carrier protein] reductase [Paenibacillus rhizosphaerae]|uniref:3-oxoacyl-[acyl-carrier protein] reductase n=1 Tax=Paenibacillus rhizosphaerae TaxID=297318 RepID=A0A839U0R0_9BACL|nr:SDR family oxidoreductase [Paenibacillus rhizosphaerae]MBB3132281.1 3-oxoacyl-[acyl-carrier protein] reductase [Paenibacillus rhizosphaerae]